MSNARERSIEVFSSVLFSCGAAQIPRMLLLGLLPIGKRRVPYHDHDVGSVKGPCVELGKNKYRSFRRGDKVIKNHIQGSFIRTKSTVRPGRIDEDYYVHTHKQGKDVFDVDPVGEEFPIEVEPNYRGMGV